MHMHLRRLELFGTNKFILQNPTGKTTFLGQLSLDFAENGVNTLWGSFEIKNTRLMHKLLQQFSRGPLPDEKLQKAQALEVLADRFENLPLYFMKFHGGSDIDDVLDAMEYSAYVHDVEHFILDNMQFMITRNSSKHNSSFDKYDIQDIAIEKFRKFATSKNVHVTLVVHPRKEAEDMKLGMSSVYGSAKATQEADNVLILQKDMTNQNRKYIEVKKNRYDGTLGICPMYFQFDSKRYSENPEAQLSSGKNAARKAVAAPKIVPMNGGRTFVSAAASTPKRTAAGNSKISAKSTYASILED
jgi:twinkle protein